MASLDAASLERAAYRSRWDDGLVDLFVGLSLVWIGMAWMWIEPLAGVAGVFPAVAVVPFIAFRNRFIEARAGYVRFSEQRRRWEQRNLVGLVMLGVLCFVGGIGAFIAFSAGGSAADLVETVAPGLIAILLALAFVLVAAVSGVVRAWVYAVVLVAGAILAIAVEANPGLPLLLAGAAVTGVGVWLLVRFVRTHPRLPTDPSAR